MIDFLIPISFSSDMQQDYHKNIEYCNSLWQTIKYSCGFICYMASKLKFVKIKISLYFENHQII